MINVVYDQVYEKEENNTGDLEESKENNEKDSN